MVASQPIKHLVTTNPSHSGGYIPSIPLAAIGLICYLVLDAIYWIRKSIVETPACKFPV